MNKLYYLAIERNKTPKFLENKETSTKKKNMTKDSKFHWDGTFDFLISCHKIKFDEL